MHIKNSCLRSCVPDTFFPFLLLLLTGSWVRLCVCLAIKKVFVSCRCGQIFKSFAWRNRFILKSLQVIPASLRVPASPDQNTASVPCGTTAPRERAVDTQRGVSGGGRELRSLKCAVRADDEREAGRPRRSWIPVGLGGKGETKLRGESQRGFQHRVSAERTGFHSTLIPHSF